MTMTLTGVYSHDNFMDVIEGTDFLELIRVEDEHIMVLLDVVLKIVSSRPL